MDQAGRLLEEPLISRLPVREDLLQEDRDVRPRGLRQALHPDRDQGRRDQAGLEYLLLTQEQLDPADTDMYIFGSNQEEASGHGLYLSDQDLLQDGDGTASVGYILELTPGKSRALNATDTTNPLKI